MQASNKRSSKDIQATSQATNQATSQATSKATITSPALKSLLARESGIQATSANSHIEAIQKRKRQELNDYLLVCTQRLRSIISPIDDITITTAPPAAPAAHMPHDRVYAIMKKTSRNWCG
jgi:hypothetical protein